MTLREAWREGTQALAQAGVETPQLDSEIIIRHLTRKGREEFYRDLGETLPATLLAHYRQLVAERAYGTPVAYLTGEKEFFGLSFRVTPAVLIPRPETETLVEGALALWRRGELPLGPRVLDIGTGSGAIAVTLALYMPCAWVVATDISAPALAIAQENAERHGVAARVEFRQGDVWQALGGAESPPAAVRFDLIVSNPPYIPAGEIERLAPEVQSEPHAALDGGADGLDFYRRLSAKIMEFLAPGGWVLLEVGQGQAEAVGGFLREAGLTVLSPLADLSGKERVVQATRQKIL